MWAGVLHCILVFLVFLFFLVTACDSAVHVLSFSHAHLCHTLKVYRSDRNLLSNVTEHLVPPN